MPKYQWQLSLGHKYLLLWITEMVQNQKSKWSRPLFFVMLHAKYSKKDHTFSWGHHITSNQLLPCGYQPQAWRQQPACSYLLAMSNKIGYLKDNIWTILFGPLGHRAWQISKWVPRQKLSVFYLLWTWFSSQPCMYFYHLGLEEALVVNRKK